MPRAPFGFSIKVDTAKGAIDWEQGLSRTECLPLLVTSHEFAAPASDAGRQPTTGSLRPPKKKNELTAEIVNDVCLDNVPRGSNGFWAQEPKPKPGKADAQVGLRGAGIGILDNGNGNDKHA